MPGLRRPALGKRLSVEDLRARGVDESFLVPEQHATQTQFLPPAIAADVHPDEQAIDQAAMGRVNFVSAGIQGGQPGLGKSKGIAQAGGERAREGEEGGNESLSTGDNSDLSDGDSSENAMFRAAPPHEPSKAKLWESQAVSGFPTGRMSFSAPSTGVAERMPELSGLSMESKYGPGYRMLVAMGYQGGGRVPLSNVKRHAGMALQDHEEDAMNEEQRRSTKRRRTRESLEEVAAPSHSSGSSCDSEEDEEELEAAECDPFYRVRKAVLTEVVQSRNQQLPLRTLAKSKRVRKALTQHSGRLHVKVLGCKGLEEYVGCFVKASMPSCRVQRKASANWSKSLKNVGSGSAEELVVSLREDELWQESDGEAKEEDRGASDQPGSSSRGGNSLLSMTEGLYGGLYGDLDLAEASLEAPIQNPGVQGPSWPTAAEEVLSGEVSAKKPADLGMGEDVMAEGLAFEMPMVLHQRHQEARGQDDTNPARLQEVARSSDREGGEEERREQEGQEEEDGDDEEEDLDAFTLQCRGSRVCSLGNQWRCHGCRTPYRQRSDLRDHLLARLLAKTTTDPTDLSSSYDGKHSDRGLMLQHSRRLTGGSGAASRFWCPLCGWLLVDGSDSRPGQQVPLEALLDHLQSAPHAVGGTRQDARLAHKRSLSLFAELLIRPSLEEISKRGATPTSSSARRRGLPTAGSAIPGEEPSLPLKLQELLSVFHAGSSAAYLEIETAVLGPAEEDMFAA